MLFLPFESLKLIGGAGIIIEAIECCFAIAVEWFLFFVANTDITSHVVALIITVVALVSASKIYLRRYGTDMLTPIVRVTVPVVAVIAVAVACPPHKPRRSSGTVYIDAFMRYDRGCSVSRVRPFYGYLMGCGKTKCWVRAIKPGELYGWLIAVEAALIDLSRVSGSFDDGP